MQVINYASAEDAEPTSFGLRKRIGLSAGAGLVVFTFLSFFLEFLNRNKKSGRMDPILRELGRDAVFGWLVRKRN